MSSPGRPPEHLAELLDFFEDVVAWVKDRDGRYTWVNRTFLLNYTLAHPALESTTPTAQILGRTDYELSPAFMADQYRLDDEYVLAGNRIVHRIERVEEEDGRAAWSLTNKVPVRDATGIIVATAGTTRRLGDAEVDPQLHSGLGPVLEFFRKHYREPITNRALAKAAGMSLRGFERRFSSVFHLTPQKYLRKLRLRIASRALIQGRESLASVALNCGFADQSHFSREFRRQFGRTPRDYREHYSAGSPQPKSGVPRQ